MYQNDDGIYPAEPLYLVDTNPDEDNQFGAFLILAGLPGFQAAPGPMMIAPKPGLVILAETKEALKNKILKLVEDVFREADDVARN